jgi:hypothetical protein
VAWREQVMSKKKDPNFRQANTCSNCKKVVFIDGKRTMQCKKHEGYKLADSVCDDYEPFK